MRKKTNGQLKKELWKLFSLYIRRRDKFTCFTCGKRTRKKGAIHAGHFIPKVVGGLALYFHEKNVHAQCYRCNINLGGWGERYAERMEQVYGRNLVHELRVLRDKRDQLNTKLDYHTLIAHYTNLLKSKKIVIH